MKVNLKKVYEELESSNEESSFISLFRKASEEEGRKIQNFYESAMTRRRDYVFGNLWFSVSDTENQDFKIYDPSGDLSLGCVCGFHDVEKDIMKVSHFAPASLRAGVALLKIINNASNTIFIFCVTEDLVSMLEKAGYVNTGLKVNQPFYDEIVEKTIFINKRAFEERKDDLEALLVYYKQYLDDSE